MDPKSPKLTHGARGVTKKRDGGMPYGVVSSLACAASILKPTLP